MEGFLGVDSAEAREDDYHEKQVADLFGQAAFIAAFYLRLYFFQLFMDLIYDKVNVRPVEPLMGRPL